MRKEKLAIISSYSDFCGNASYTKALSSGLSEHYDLSVISLNINLLRKERSKQGKEYIQHLCEQLQSFDCVNIQFEAGLFGSSISKIKKNFFRIAKSSKRLVLTMHRVHAKIAYPSIGHQVKTIVSGGGVKRCIRDIAGVYAQNRYVTLYKKIIRFCIAKQAPIIVHTQKDKEFIQRIGANLVFDHPLSFYNQSYIQSLANSYSREDFCKELVLDPNDIYLGIFGFINQYKGHETAIKSLEYLPPNYKLIIFGAQHPHTIGICEKINPYIKGLISLIEQNDLVDRVMFYRIVNDDEFVKALLRCDFNLLPYLEVNQGGSGIAALSLETNSNAIFSQTHTFFELEKYAPGAFKMFSIGNYHELARAILSYRKTHFASHLEKYHDRYNLATNVNLYKRLLSRDFSTHNISAQRDSKPLVKTWREFVMRALILFFVFEVVAMPSIPSHLINEYTLNGRIPIGWCYGNEAYADSTPIIYQYDQVEMGRLHALDRRQFSYGITDTLLYQALDAFPIKGKQVAIMGSRTPAYESITLAWEGSPTTIEYNKVISEHPQVKTMTVNEFVENPQLFDAVISISSYEHDGLGRYGDPLNPIGDLIAMENTKKMLKKGGLLYLAVPVGRDCFVWNAHRIYGSIRLPMLLNGWDVIGEFGFTTNDYNRNPDELYHPVFVLRPKE